MYSSFHFSVEYPNAGMDRPSDSQKPQSNSQQRDKSTTSAQTTPRNLYLILYNSVSAISWSVVLGQVILTASSYGPKHVFEGVGEFTKWTQTLAVLEIVHSVIGTVIHLRNTRHKCVHGVAIANHVLGLRRSSKSTNPYNAPPSRLPHLPRLGHRLPLPRRNNPKHSLLHYAPRLEHDRGDPILLLRGEYRTGRCSRLVDVVEV